MYHVFAAVIIIVAIPYVVTFLEIDVVLPARYKDTLLFGIMFTFDDVLEIMVIVVPLAYVVFDVHGIYKFTEVFSPL